MGKKFLKVVGSSTEEEDRLWKNGNDLRRDLCRGVDNTQSLYL